MWKFVGQVGLGLKMLGSNSANSRPIRLRARNTNLRITLKSSLLKVHCNVLRLKMFWMGIADCRTRHLWDVFQFQINQSWKLVHWIQRRCSYSMAFTHFGHRLRNFVLRVFCEGRSRRKHVKHFSDSSRDLRKVLFALFLFRHFLPSRSYCAQFYFFPGGSLYNLADNWR